jgi:arylsulfatase A-like enzyme
MLGIAAPTDSKQHGRDFSPLLRGESVSDWRTEIYGQYDLHNAGLAFMRMVRTDRWKLVRHHMSDGSNELYDLKDDPGEGRNRYYDKSAFAERDALQMKLTAWQQSIDDPVLKLDAGRPIEPGPPVGQ